MAVPYTRIRAVLGGTIMSVQDWSCQINVVGTPVQDGLSVNQGFLDTWIQNRVVNVRDWWTTGTAGGRVSDANSSDVNLSYLRAYLILAGSDTAALLSESNFGAALPGSGTGGNPTQTAMVVSTRSAIPGRSGRGRMYLPATGAAIGVGHVFSTSIINGVVTRTAQLLTDFGTSSYQDVPLQAVVASTAGARPILRVEVDNEPDTQRRRANKIQATNTVRANVAQ